MDYLELNNVVERLHDGECPVCRNKLIYTTNEIHIGTLEKNGMADKDDLIEDSHFVFCNTCGYNSKAIQIGLKIIPVDRIVECDINWDKKYLEDNTVVWGKEGDNPFEKKETRR